MLGGRINSWVGSNHASGVPTVASATTTTIDDSFSSWLISGSATITALLTASNTVTPGHLVEFMGAPSAAAVFTNTDDTVTSGKMDLGGSDVTLGERDVLVLRRLANGAWIRHFSTNN